MIVVKYFGSIAQKTNSDEDFFSFSNSSLTQFVDRIKQKHQLDDFVFSVAVNQTIILDLDNYALKSDDIIAFLPPFSGG